MTLRHMLSRVHEEAGLSYKGHNHAEYAMLIMEIEVRVLSTPQDE